MSKDTSREDSSDSGSSSGSGSGGSNTTAEWRTGYIQGNTFHNKEVKYRIINGVAIFEGDIILASTPEEIERPIMLANECVTGDVIHEIGHAVGLWHEISRRDRDTFIRIIWDNVDPQFTHNFDQHITDGDDVGGYDYRSIMHYGAWFFNKTPGQPTIEVRRPDLPGGNANSIGQKNGLSNGDIAAVIQMYANIAPTILQNTDGRLEAFLVGSSNGQLYHKQQILPNDISWSGGWDQNWSSLGSQFNFLPGQRPTIVKNADATLDVFWVSDGNLTHSYQATPNGSWGNESLHESYGEGYLGTVLLL